MNSNDKKYFFTEKSNFANKQLNNLSKVKQFFHCKSCFQLLFLNDNSAFINNDNSHEIIVHKRTILHKNLKFSNFNVIFCKKCDIRLGECHYNNCTFFRYRVISVYMARNNIHAINEHFCLKYFQNNY